MLCDWLSLRYEVKTAADLALVDALGKDRDVCVRLKGGELVTQWWPRESKSSDTHRITVGLSLGAITIDGSPARVGESSNVFGSGNPTDCARSMLLSASKACGVILPELGRWRATRIDLTQNYDCGPHVNEALESLRQVAGGHLRVRAVGQSAMWNEGSDLWSAIAYPKGPHLQKQVRRGLCRETAEHVELANRLLRLEVRLRNKYLRRMDIEIGRFDEVEAMKHFQIHAEKLIPSQGCQITSAQQFADRLVSMFGTRRARTLLGTWALVCQIGEQGARARMSKPTWYDHQRDLFRAGLGRGDLAQRQVVAIRPRQITARPVDSWADLQRAA